MIGGEENDKRFQGNRAPGNYSSQATGRTTPHWPTERYVPPPKKQEPVRRATVETGAGMILGSALVLIMKHVFKTDLSIEDALIVVSAVGLVANYLSGEVARLRVWAPEK